MAAHTPGPWHWKRVPLPGVGSGPFDIADLLEDCAERPVLRHYAQTWHIQPEDKAVIAAAPELLEALVCLIQQTEGSCYENETGPLEMLVAWQEAKAAIAKARCA